MNFEKLKNRIGETHLRQRMNLQIYYASKIFGRGRTLFHIENVHWLHHVIYYFLKAIGLYGIGYKNFLDLQVTKNTFYLPHLPEEFEGFKIMQMTDLHIDFIDELTDVIIQKVNEIDYDLCVLTGDYCVTTNGYFRKVLFQMEKIFSHLKKPVYITLGNHDYIQMVEPLEEIGYECLLNETVPLEINGKKIYLSGVDDPHFYQTENIEKAREPIPQDSVSILLSHSPEIYKKAAASGYDAIICGHTHGGQICLPGGIPIFNNTKGKRKLISGPWKYMKMQGYTSVGTGSSGVPVRYFCPPEITVHTLTKKQKP